MARPSYSDFIDYEETATYIRSFQALLIAGLLQTADYARAIVRAAPSTLGEGEVDALVAARMERQELLKRDNPQDPSGPVLTVSDQAWSAFLADIKRGTPPLSRPAR